MKQIVRKGGSCLLTLSNIIKKNSRTSSLSLGSLYQCSYYHSYPDPNEKPQISRGKSDGQRMDKNTKSNDDVKVSETFRLDKAFPGVPISTGLKDNSIPQTLSTKLSNGLVVASQDIPGLMSSFTFIVGTGSSSEIQNSNDGNAGATHMIELTAFRSTKNRSFHEFSKEMEQVGGMVQCLSTRENIIYCVDVLRENLEKAIELLADTVINPLLSKEEIEEGKEVMKLQHDNMQPDMLSRDCVQMAAFTNQPLGNFHFCPLDKVDNITDKTIHEFRNRYYFGENCIVAGAGVEHESFVKIIQDKFKAIPSRGPDAKEKQKRGASDYSGGLYIEKRHLNIPFIKVAVGFKIGGWNDKKLVASCVLQQLLGGGSSFSAGGPGKGMYTRLYREVLNRHYWVESAESFISVHEDAGLFGIDGATDEQHVPHLLRVLLEHLIRLGLEPVSDEELNRAKNMLKSMMMMQLESRLVLCEDIGRQFVTYGKRESPAEVCKKIEEVTAMDLQNIAKEMLSHPPSVSMVGEKITLVPTFDDIKRFTDAAKAELQQIYEKKGLKM
jgi:processing peptidase subunit alpha